MMNKNRILLIFPKLGPYDQVIKDMPLSLIYAARIAQKEGFAVTIIDQRLIKDWQKVIAEELKKEPILAGISVMTGKPIKYALEVSSFIKKHCDIPVVWGGVHPTILFEQTLANENIDIVVRGEGEKTLYELAASLLKNKAGLSSIKGISFKDGNRLIHNEKDSIGEAIRGYFDTGYIDEVIVVNNNAASGTKEIVEKTNAKQIFEKKQGYGYAIRRGIDEIRSDLIVISEPDNTFCAADIIKLLAYADDYDAV